MWNNMKKCCLILIFSLLGYLCYSQESSDSIIKNAIDTIDYNRFQIVLFDDSTWEYVNHDSIMRIIRFEDSVKIYNYIFSTKMYLPDTTELFFNNWDTVNIHAYGGIDYFNVSDTLVIPLVNDTIIFHMPSNGDLQSKFGWRWGRIHNGIDLKQNSGDTVVAAFDGKVRFAGWNSGGYGNLVIIRHFNGLETYYAHLSEINVKKNQYIKAGELVGLAGRTGRAYGDHLHFEIRYMDNSFDPELMIDVENNALVRDTIVLMPEIFEHIKELSQAQYHTVRKGDTLWGISRRFGVSVSFICNLNGINSDDPLRIGQRLRVR